jgi:hypothetical protein
MRILYHALKQQIQIYNVTSKEKKCPLLENE